MRISTRNRRHAVSLATVLVVSLAATCARADVYLPGDGTNTVVQQGIVGLPVGNGTRSFIAWVNISSVPANGEALVGYGSINPFSGYHRSAFDIDPNGQLDAQFQVGYVVSTGVALSTGTWNQVVSTYSPSGGVVMYVNGQPVATTAGVNGFNSSAVDTININNNAATFGYEYSVTGGYTDINTTGLEFHGHIAADSIWDRVLTPAEVLADYNAVGTLPDSTGLLAEAFGTVPGSSNAVPEPTSFALLAIGFIGLWTARIRRG